MLISDSKKFIFIHNYKVAGTSITHALYPYGTTAFTKLEWLDNLLIASKLMPKKYISKLPKHLRTPLVQSHLSKTIFDTYFKFGFVRDPWDYQVSLYHFMLKDKSHPEHQMMVDMPNFDKYIEWRVRPENCRLQKEFFYNQAGECLVNFIGKYEDLHQDFQKICTQLNIKAALPHLNKSKKNKSYLNYYSPKSIDLIYEHFQEDLKVFGYEKPI